MTSWSPLWSLIGVLACVCSALLFLKPRVRGEHGSAVGGVRQSGLSWASIPVVLLVVGLILGLAFALAIGVEPLVAVVLGAAGWVVAMLRRRQRRRQAADASRALVAEACEAMASEMRAGRSAQLALERGAEVWPGLAPVVASVRLDADVPATMVAASTQPGAEVLVELAAFWAISAQTGSGLALAVEQVADRARSHLATRHLVTRELAGAQATARMVFVLPVVALLVSQGSGSGAVEFLTTHPVGLGCLAGGLGFALLGLIWIEAIVSAVDRECGR
ncbi:MAG: hypothetical protein HZY75_02270 [Nocardioidaceae bacterium]|nr:MAG: hypothetical protein HZY75_02270 [Nocardioidaceae bacterium]